MKKHLFGLFLLGIITCALPMHAMAADNKPPVLKEDDHQSKIALYEKPDPKSLVITQLSLDNRIIPFYKEKNWMKVGLPTNGLVGWINITEYRQARENSYRQNFQTLYVQVTPSKDEKNSNKITAYKNGKKLDDAEAIKLYRQLQQKNQQQMDEFFLQHAAWLERMHSNFNLMQMLDSDDFPPIIVLQNIHDDDSHEVVK